jgi:RHS repeat-associated protein
LTQKSYPDTTTVNYTYDNDSRLTQVVDPTGTYSFTFDNMGRLTATTTSYSFLTSRTFTTAYSYDAASNRTAKTDQYASVTSNYSYDSIYELTQVTQSSTTTESYSFDPVGNRTASLGVSTYTNNSSNELTSTSNATYTYDNNGNTVNKVVGSNTTQYFWDYENRMSSVTLPGSGGTVSFKYDPFGRRIYKSSSSGTSIFAYDAHNLVEETNASGTAVARYSQGLDIDVPLASLRSSITSFYEADGLGTITSLSNGAGSLVQTYGYDSFGKQTSSSGSLTNPFEYTARELDPETSLYYYRARYYDPSAGRFISEDPIQFRAGPDFYTYVSQSPVNLFDPFGLQDWNEQQTLDWLRKAYASATAGPIQGLLNIKNHSTGDWDFGWSAQYHNDTWTRCGKKMNADQFGNYIAGFQGGAYDHNLNPYPFLLVPFPPPFLALPLVQGAGVYYHISGKTKAKNDRFDRTGMPDILAGAADGWFFGSDPNCKCSK